MCEMTSTIGRNTEVNTTEPAAANGTPLVSVVDLHKSYGEVVAVRGVEVRLGNEQKSEIVSDS